MATENGKIEFEGFPAHQLDAARDALAKSHARLCRAAAKAGQAAPAAPTLTVVATQVRSRCRNCKLTVDGFPPARHVCPREHHQVVTEGSWISIELVDLELDAERPALAGWVFLAAVEPLEGGNLIRQVPGADVAEGELARWATGAIACDHCQARRRRTETFVVRADGSDPAVPAGTYRQVGRQCLAAFLGGKSAASIIAQLAWTDVVRAIGDEDGDGGWGGGRSARLLDPTVFLAQTAAVIRLDGWMSRGAARTTESRSTADHVLDLLTPPFSDPRGTWHRDAERCAPTASDVSHGTAALAWARALAGASDYERNLSLVARQPGLKREHAGILASAVSAYARELGREVERKRLASASAANPSQHVGTVGERLNLELTVQRVASVETDYGALRIISMRDNTNNLFIWKTGSTTAKPGELLKVCGSVKKHDEYRGERQTVLTRCKIVDEFPAPKAKRARKAKAPIQARALGDEVSFSASYEATCRDVRTGTIVGIHGKIAHVRLGDAGPCVSVSLSYLHDAGAFAVGDDGIAWTDAPPKIKRTRRATANRTQAATECVREAEGNYATSCEL